MATEGWWIFKYDPIKEDKCCYQLIDCCCEGEWLLELLCIDTRRGPSFIGNVIKRAYCCCFFPEVPTAQDMMGRDDHPVMPAAQPVHGHGQWQGPPWQAGGVNHQPQHLPQMHYGPAHHQQFGGYGFDQHQLHQIPPAHRPNGH